MATKCIICQLDIENPQFYGELLKKNEIAIHHFCLLFAYGLAQREKDSSAFLGFQIEDIKKYAEKIKENMCIYCNQKNAAAFCFTCKNYFHFPCGVKKYCHYEFTGDFKSYCHEHIKIRHKSQHENNLLCVICLSAMKTYHPVKSVNPKCCPLIWLHRSCIGKFALSAGYNLKCIWCQKSDFRDKARLEGIFVPDRDAEWEREPHKINKNI